MSLNAPTVRGIDLSDERSTRPVTASRTVYEGMVWNVRRDTVDLGKAGSVDREYIEHPGAVVVVALRDRDDVPGRDEILLIKQYRHPIGATEWELPAGLLDVEGEDPASAAARELAEEVDLRAARWHTLVDFHSSPGGLSEALRVYVARELEDITADERHRREAEEADMTRAWVDLGEAFAAVLAGRINNAGAVVGILAAYGARQAAWATLRPADAPWPAHPRFR